MAGLSVATVRKIETGAVTEPGYFTVLAIATAIGVNLADLAELQPGRVKTGRRAMAAGGGSQRRALPPNPLLIWTSLSLSTRPALAAEGSIRSGPQRVSRPAETGPRTRPLSAPPLHLSTTATLSR